MSKPGEMVQILRESYEEQLEAYRLLRNKFLIAVPGMDLDKEKQLYDQWKLDLHLNSIISFDRALHPETRTCETCGCGPLPGGVPCSDWRPRSPQSADVETVREALESLAHAASCGYAMSLNRCNEISDEVFAALDRIAGMLRGSA